MKPEEKFEELWQKQEWTYGERFQFSEVIKRVVRYWFLEGYKVAEETENTHLTISAGY